MTASVGVGDLNGDGKNDLVARDKTGTLWLYPGNSQGGFSARHPIASGVPQSWKLLAIGDVDDDRKNNLCAVDWPFVRLWSGTGKGGLKRSAYGDDNLNIDPREVHF
ncbi:FG-GAP repeat domain-containing protein [Streptomyces sp. NPDC054933]